MRYVAMALIGLAMASPALAQEASVQEHYTGYQLLAKGRYDTVIRQLQPVAATAQNMPERTLNLATAYAKSGHVAEARSLYMQVLAAPAVDLDMLSGGAATSHQIAQRGLTMIGQTIATR